MSPCASLSMTVSAWRSAVSILRPKSCCHPGVLRQFIREFFDQNPLSHLGILVLRNGVAERLTDLSGSPVRPHSLCFSRNFSGYREYYSFSLIAEPCLTMHSALRDQNLRLLSHVSSVSIKHAKDKRLPWCLPCCCLSWHARTAIVAHSQPCHHPHHAPDGMTNLKASAVGDHSRLLWQQ